jgi:CDP-diacylglycerol--glycerol-3-phosphate 3-phosphatidyltransferase
MTIIKKVWTVPNILSLLRLILAPIVGHFIYWDYHIFSIIIIVIALSLDVLDGYIARHFNQKSELGKILDPLADKVLYAFIAITLFLKNALPFWFVLLYLLRDLSLLLGGLIISKKVKEVPQADKYGKITAAIVAFSLFSIILGAKFIDPYFLLLAIIVAYFSGINYAYVNLKRILNPIEKK